MEDVIERFPPHCREMVVNIILVSQGVREAALLELRAHGVTPRERQDLWQLLERLELRAQVEHEELQRWLVTQRKAPVPKPLTEEALARLLGFAAVGHDYSNRHIDRWLAQAAVVLSGGANVIFYAEMAEVSRLSREALEHHVERLAQAAALALGLFTETQVTLQASIETRVLHLQQRDEAYVASHRDEYEDDLDNHWAYPSRVADLLDLRPLPWEFLALFWERFMVDPPALTAAEALAFEARLATWPLVWSEWAEAWNASEFRDR